MASNTRHDFEPDSEVIFEDVKGMTEVNGQVYKVSVPSKSSGLFIPLNFVFFFPRSIYINDW